MMRQGKLWLALAVIASIAIFGMAALTNRLLSLEDARQQAERDAWVEENVRLALWRMDSRLAALLTQAVATIDAFTPQKEPGVDPLAAAPSDASSHWVAWSPETAWWRAVLRVSPDAPTIVLAAVQSPREANGTTLASDPISPATLAGILAESDAPDFLEALTSLRPAPTSEPSKDEVASAAEPNDPQSLKNQKEYDARAQIVQEANIAPRRMQERSSPPGDWSTGDPVVALWWRGHLLIAHAPSKDDFSARSVLVANWQWIHEDLRKLVADILPNVTLSAALSSRDREGSRLLAALPCRIDPGVVPWTAIEDASALRMVLWIAWTALALAILATAILVRGVVALSERRAAFVSSVTHELRTPLTTLRMYAEMLVEGMVHDDDTRREYLGTLRGEADRLGVLVENVLAYARLERQGKRHATSPMPMSSLHALFQGRIESRAQQAGLELRIGHLPDQVRRLMADPVAVEQILFNLVDNACKYGANGADRAIDVSFLEGRRWIAIVVADHGNGVEKASRSSLFQPFRRSPDSRRPQAPGVGLGLALSRQMARQMGGDLRLARNGPGGAAFELRLPFA